MRLGYFAARVPEATEIDGGYAIFVHGTVYSIELTNDSASRCDACVSIDGRQVGVWRIGANDSVRIEHPADDRGRFTFFSMGSVEATAAQLENNADLGLITVEFRAEKQVRPSGVSLGSSPSPAPEDCQVGGTGLTGTSSQEFTNVRALEYDPAEVVTIHLRLIAPKTDVRPLAARSTPIPPSISGDSAAPAPESSPAGEAIESRPSGGHLPLIGQILVAPVLLFLLMGATNGIATSAVSILYYGGDAGFIAGIVGAAILLPMAYLLILAYRSFDRNRKKQLRGEYRGVFGVRFRPTESAAVLLFLLGVGLGIAGGVVGGGTALTLPFLAGGAVSFACSLDRIRQRKVVLKQSAIPAN